MGVSVDKLELCAFVFVMCTFFVALLNHNILCSSVFEEYHTCAWINTVKTAWGGGGGVH